MTQQHNQSKQNQQGKKNQTRAPRESTGKSIMRKICFIGRPFLFFWIFFEMDNGLQWLMEFASKGFGGSGLWVAKSDFLMVWGFGLCGYMALWAIESFLLNDKKG